MSNLWTAEAIATATRVPVWVQPGAPAPFQAWDMGAGPLTSPASPMRLSLIHI